MLIKQLSVFIENRKGRLEDVIGALDAENVNIVSISLADTNEYGILRLVTDSPDKALSSLRGRGFSATISDVLAVRIAKKAGQLHKLLTALAELDLNVEYMYILDSDTENGAMAVKVAEAEAGRAVKALEASGFKVLKPEEVYG